MESLIAKLLQDFEHGKMDRRQLIKSLAVAATAAAAAAPAASAAGKPNAARRRDLILRSSELHWGGRTAHRLDPGRTRWIGTPWNHACIRA